LVLQRRRKEWAMEPMAVLEPVGSFAIRVLPLLEGEVVQGVLIWGEGPLMEAEVVEVEVVLDDGSVDTADATVGEIEDEGRGCELDG
jgi:hypothetical protein